MKEKTAFERVRKLIASAPHISWMEAVKLGIARSTYFRVKKMVRNGRQPKRRGRESFRRVGDLWRCSSCKGLFPATHFYKGNGAGGLRSVCKKCSKEEKKKSNKYWPWYLDRAKQLASTPVEIWVTRKQWLDLLEFTNFTCAYCGVDIREKPTMDHITALSKGGLHTIDNVIPSCRKCNREKNNR